MPRIRTIKPEFWSDEKLGPLTAIDRLTFLGLISMADDAGRLLDNVKIIDAFVFPETSETCRESLATLSRLGRIIRGKTSSGQAVIQISNWTKHQKVDKPNNKSCLPALVDSDESNSNEVSENTDGSSIRESVANESRERREEPTNDSRGPRVTTYDQRPTTNDHGPTTDDHRPPEDAAIAAVSVAATGMEILDAWNGAMGQNCMLTKKRREALRLRLNDPFFVASWRAAIDKAKASDFCNGGGETGWRADFEWFLKPESVVKLVEGKYDNRNGGQHRTKAQQRVENSKRIIEEFSSADF